jgi:hypothetical protein
LPLPALAFAPFGVHGAFVALGVAMAVLVFVLEARRRRTLDDRLVIILAGSWPTSTPGSPVRRGGWTC